MVTLFLTAFDQQVNPFDFRCQLTSFDDSLELLTKIVTQGHTLVTAYLVDETGRTPLPVAAFDGVPLRAGLQALENEWQQALGKPWSFDGLQQQALIALHQRRVKLHTQSIRAHQLMIDQLIQWIQRVQAGGPLSARSLQLIQRYEYQQAAHQAYLVKAQASAGLAAKRLSQLEA